MQPFEDDRSALASGYDQVTPAGDAPEPGGPEPAGAAVAESDRGVIDLTGYAVEATDGTVGTVASGAGGALVVDTGPWVLGRTVRLGADAVDRVDHPSRVVHVRLTREQVKDYP